MSPVRVIKENFKDTSLSTSLMFRNIYEAYLDPNGEARSNVRTHIRITQNTKTYAITTIILNDHRF